jgi:hypothetical protein
MGKNLGIFTARLDLDLVVLRQVALAAQVLAAWLLPKSSK